MMNRRKLLLGTISTGLFFPFISQASDDKIASLSAKIYPQVVNWRRYLHQNPELSNREFKTSEFVAKELKKLGLKVREKIAHTGVIGILEGGQAGPCVALRADMDGLPVLEKTGLEFASKAMGEYEGKNVPIAHACGHDAHIAMLLGAANVLSAMKSQIAGKIAFVFQPAEEGSPAGEEGGAKLMVKEGIIEDYNIKSIFGIHVWNGPSGEISYRPKGLMAGADRVEITLSGKQTHGSAPWTGVDLSALAADIVSAVNQILARQINVTTEPSVLSITTIHGGDRFNIIPETFKLSGTLRTFSDSRRDLIVAKVEKTIKNLADSYGATAQINFDRFAPPTVNDPQLTSALKPALLAAVRSEKLLNDAAIPVTGSEDFSQFQRKVPGVFVFLGATPPDKDFTTLPVNHSPYYNIYEPIMETGVRAHCQAALKMLDIFKS
jgi:amidohydrolase